MAEDIKKEIETLVNYHNNRVTEQTTDLEYYNDEFKTGIVSPYHAVRLGSGARIVDNIVSHIETGNPQVFREPKKNTATARDSAKKVARFLNYLIKEFLAEINEGSRNAVQHGEGEFQVEFNPDAYEKKRKDYTFTGKELPIKITALDPVVTFCYPHDVLVPDKVVKQFDIDINLGKELTPDLMQKRGLVNVQYTAYYDADRQYRKVGTNEIDGGEKKNVLGFCPFVHFYAGFGKRSAEGKPETLAVGKLRKIRGRLKQQCELVSRVDSIIGLFANPIYKIQKTEREAEQVTEEELKRQVIGPGATLVSGWGYTSEIYTPRVDISQIYAELAEVNAALGLEDPPIMSGVASSSRASGRQEDIEFGHIQKKYAKLINNFEASLGTLLGMCLRILDTYPQALPITFRGEVMDKGEKVLKEEQITKEDIDKYYDCTVKLNPDQSLEDDRNFMKYRILANEGRISWKRFLIEGLGLTEYEADELIAEALAEQAIQNNPMLRAAREEEAIKQMGAERFIKEAQQDTELQQRMQEELKSYTPSGGQVRPSEARNPAAMGTARQLLGGETPGGIRESPNV